MTQISIILDKYDEFVSTQLSGYQLLPNAYTPEDNPELFLQKGYAVAYGTGKNGNKHLGCELSIIRDFAIIIARLIDHTESDGLAFQELQKSVAEDAFKLIKWIEQNPQLEETAEKTEYVSDSGIQEMSNGDSRAKYLVTTLLFETEYFEILN